MERGGGCLTLGDGEWVERQGVGGVIVSYPVRMGSGWSGGGWEGWVGVSYPVGMGCGWSGGGGRGGGGLTLVGMGSGWSGGGWEGWGGGVSYPGGVALQEADLLVQLHVVGAQLVHLVLVQRQLLLLAQRLLCTSNTHTHTHTHTTRHTHTHTKILY